MAPTPEQAQPSKPGTACLCCRRRKLKCSREPSGCANCVKAELPCIYPTPETGVKRKRGPYKKKDKPAREAHLEHVVKYLSDPVSRSKQDDTSEHDKTVESSSRSPPPSLRSFDKERSALTRLAAREPERASEDLVKDALVALTRTSVSDNAFLDNHTRGALPKHGHAPAIYVPPSPKQLFDLWHLYTTRVDPVTKVVHCPTFSSKMSSMVDGTVSGSTANLAISIYFAAVSSCNADECWKLFGQTKASMLMGYREVLEQDLVRNHAIPDLEHMQALVLYLLCLCREDSAADTRALFSLAVRNAQLVGLHMEPSSTFTPYEAELRRRLWWTICSLENACSEEGISRSTCLFAQVAVSMPSNIEDRDLQPNVTEQPEQRVGITSMSFVLIRWDIMRSNVRLWSISKDKSTVGSSENKAQMQREFDELGKYLEERYLRHCHTSRPFDWLIMTIADVMMIKCCLTIQHPGKLTDNDVPPAQRLEVLRLSVLVIRIGYKLLTNPKCPDHFWFFRSYLQWHSLAIVIAEISHSKDQHFVQTAWGVLKPFINVWDRVYKNKARDKTWDYVNLLISKAKASAITADSDNPTVAGRHSNCTSGMFPFTAVQSEPALDMTAHENPANAYSSSEMPESYTFDNIPLDIDFDALNAVFSSSNWEDALNVQIA